MLDRRGLLFGFGVVLLLAACSGGEGRSPGLAPIQKEQPLPLHKVTVAGPHGFCVDRASSNVQGDPAVIVFGNCAAISGNPFSEQPKKPALLTASVARQTTPDASIGATMSAIDGFFRSAKGRAALSRSGRSESVEVMESLSEGGSYYVRLKDRSPPTVPGAQEDYWRGYFDLGDNVVSLSVTGFERNRLSPSEGLALVKAFQAATVKATGGAADVSQAATQGESLTAIPGAGLLRPPPRPGSSPKVAPQSGPPPQQKRETPFRKIGIFRKLFM